MSRTNKNVTIHEIWRYSSIPAFRLMISILLSPSPAARESAGLHALSLSVCSFVYSRLSVCCLFFLIQLGFAYCPNAFWTKKRFFSKKLSNLELLSLLTTNRKSHMGFWKTHSWTLRWPWATVNLLPWPRANFSSWPTEKPRTLPHSKPPWKTHPK